MASADPSVERRDKIAAARPRGGTRSGLLPTAPTGHTLLCFAGPATAWAPLPLPITTDTTIETRTACARQARLSVKSLEFTPDQIVAAIRELVKTSQMDRARELVSTASDLFPADDDIKRWHRILSPPKTTRITLPTDAEKRREEFNWLKEHAQDFRGKWVVISGSELKGVADRLQEALKMARNKGHHSGGLVHRIPE